MTMALETAKPQAAIGAGALAALISQAVFAIWPQLVGQAWVETAITLALTLAAAGWGAWQARNKVTPAQIATAIQQGDVRPQTVANVAGNTAPAKL